MYMVRFHPTQLEGAILKRLLALHLNPFFLCETFQLNAY
jgi:hypothetical protein